MNKKRVRFALLQVGHNDKKQKLKILWNLLMPFIHLVAGAVQWLHCS